MVNRCCSFIASKLGILLSALIFNLIILFSPCCLAKQDTREILSKQYKYIVLSIDGGGIRGIIAARILQEIEQRTGKQIHEMFDLISGNSTGGIIALALVTPSQQNSRALYRAFDLVELYKNRGGEIFSKSYWWQMKTGAGLWGARYDRSNLDKILEEKFGSATLSNTLKPVVIISYSLDRQDVHLWTSGTPEIGNNNDFFLKDIAGATSAAPTYFEPKKVMNTKQKYCYIDKQSNIEKICYEADGGIFANNPSQLAISEIYRVIPSLPQQDILLISIGSGKTRLNRPIENLKDSGVIGWVLKANLIEIMMDATNEALEWEVGFDVNTVRLQVDLSKDLGEMDNTSKENIEMLIKVTEDYIKNNNDLIDSLCEHLISYQTLKTKKDNPN